MKSRHCSTAVLLGICAFAVSGVASAATWVFNNVTSNTQNGVTATASAWANTVGSANVLLESAYLTTWGSSGLGVKNKDSSAGDTNEGVDPEHAIDNDQRKDSVLFSFSGDKVNLTSSYFGWVSTASGYGDSDFSVYAFTGAGLADLAGVAYSDAGMATAGWTLVGHHSGGSSAGWKTINATDIYSSYWLIGANAGANDSKKDAFKLLKIAGTTCADNPKANGCGYTPPGGVPEPGTLLLMGAGLLGMTRLVRRQRT